MNQNFEKTLNLKSFSLVHGDVVLNLKINYSILGNVKNPIIVVLGGISSNHVLNGENGWWDNFVGNDKAIDTDKYCVISIEYFSGDTCINSSQNTHRIISPYDQVNLIKILLENLAIKNIDTIIGSSYGGMVALAFGEQNSHLVNRIICICAAHKNSIKSIALREIQRNIVKLTRLSKEGVALARSLAMIGYRGEQEFEERFALRPDIVNGKVYFEVSNYLNHNGQKFAEKFDTNRYINLSRSIDIHHINPKKIESKLFLVGIDSDQLVPIKLIQELKNLKKQNCSLNKIHSKYGHDGFLIEHQKIGSLIQDFLSLS